MYTDILGQSKVIFDWLIFSSERQLTKKSVQCQLPTYLKRISQQYDTHRKGQYSASHQND